LYQLIIMSVARKIAYNVVFNALAKVLSTALALIAIGFITRYLGKEGFGEYAIALAFFSFFGAIADLGLYSIATREISRKDADEKKIMGNVFTIRLITSFFVVVISPAIVWFFPYSEEVKIAILLTAAAFFLSSSYMVLNGVFQKNLAMDRVALTEFIGKILQVGTIIWVVQQDLGFLAIVASLVVYMLFNFVVVFLLSRKFIRFRLQLDVSFLKKFIRESLPMGGAVLITFFYFKFDTILLSIMKNSEAVGIYNGAYKIIENITFFPAMIIGLILPLLSRYIFEERDKFNFIANKTFKVFSLLIVPVIIGGAFLAHDIVTLIGGEEFIDSESVLQILVLALGLIFIGHIFNAVLIVGNKQKTLMKVLAFCAVFNVVANSIFIPMWSYIGAAWTSVATELLVVILTGWIAYKKLGYLPRLNGTWKILISGACMAGFLVLATGYHFIIALLGSISIYGLALIFTRAISKNEIKELFFNKEIKIKNT
jgi:O-antigen/teichoic acid export membrane protein